MRKKTFYKIGITVLSGILSFVLSRHVLVIDTVYAVRINCAILLPVLIAQAWGIRYALLAAACGAFWCPFISNPTMGSANLLFSLNYLLYFAVNGYYHNKTCKNGFCHRSILAEIGDSIVFYISTIVLIPFLLPFNKLWEGKTDKLLIQYVSPTILQIQTINLVLGLVCIFMMAKLLLMLPFVRRFFLLEPLVHGKLMTKTFLSICMGMVSFVFFDSVLDGFYVQSRGFHVSILMRNTGGLSRLPLLLMAVLFICYYCMYHITKEEDSKNSLKYREEQYRKIFENIIDVYFEINEEGKVQNCSPSFEKTFKYSPDYMIGSDLGEILCDRKEADHLVGKLFQENEITNYEVAGISGRKQELSLLLEGKTIVDHQGKKVGIIMARDIGTLRETEEKMKYFSANLNSVIEANKDAIWIVDGQKYSLILSNHRFKKIVEERYAFKPEPEDYVNKIGLFENKIDMDEICSKAIDEGAQTIEVELDIGEIYEISFYPIKISERETNLAVFARNVTEKRIAEKEIRNLNTNLKKLVDERTKELRQAYSYLETYSYTVSHELKTPVREIDAYIDIIEEDTEGLVSNQTKQDFHDIKKICADTLDMIVKMMQYARIGYTVVHVETIDMEKTVTECMRELEVNYQSKEIDLKIFELPTLEGDRFLIKQAVFNVLSNSLKFSRKRNIIHITVGQMKNKDKTIYYFADNGVGFLDEERSEKKVFELFDRMHTQEEYEGSGVGLATVKRII